MTVFKEYIVRVDSFVPDAIYERSLEEVVRCRDCKDMHEQPWNALTATGLWCVEHGIPVDVDGYCAWATRRDA